jgi:fucose permease
MSEQNSVKLRIIKILLHVGFFLSGIATVLIGQVLPILSAKFSLNDEQSGNFFPAQFAGTLTGTVLTNWFGKRGNFLMASLLGCFSMAGGVLLLNLGSQEFCLLGFFINGIGIGMTLPAMNMLILELNPARTVSALSILNFSWGFGAILSQPFVDIFRTELNILLPTVILSISLILTGLGMIFAAEERSRQPVLDGAEKDLAPFRIWAHPVAWMIAAFNFIHVGFESSMGGWLKTYTQRIDETSTAFPPIVLFFVFFIVGRGFAPVFFRFFGKNTVLFLDLIFALTGMVILLYARDLWMLSIGASVAGFGTSSIFPTNLSRFSEFFGPSASRRATPFFICGTIGAAFTTWTIGFTSNHFNSLQAGMFLLIFSLLAMIVLQIVLSLQKPFRDPLSN